MGRIVITLKDDTKVILEEIRSAGEQKKYLTEMKEVARAVNQEPGRCGEQWINNIRTLFLIREPVDYTLVGFASFRFFENKIINIPATMILPQYHSKGLAGQIIRRMFKKMILQRLKYIWRSPFALFAPIYLLFRTQHPKLYYKMQHRLEIYPSIKHKTIPVDIGQIARKYTQKLWPNFEFDGRNFVVKEAYKDCPSLVLFGDEVPWCNDAQVNNLFEERLKLSEYSLDSLLIIGKKNFL